MCLAGAVACSVKEFREECPVYVVVLVNHFLEQGLDDGYVMFHETELINREQIRFEQYAKDGYVWPCSRDGARAAVISGVENEQFIGSCIRVPYGMQAGLIWSYGESFEQHCDEYVISAVPHKQYCMVKFLFGTDSVNPPNYPWRFRITAECNGLDVYTSEPQEGEYCCVVGPNARNEWYGVIPRQKENRLLMEIFVPNEDDALHGDVVYTIDLGKRFEQKGYDWTKQDLGDISIRVGFNSSDIDIVVEDWVHNVDWSHTDI